MDGNLRDQFDLAVHDDPGADAGHMALTAITQGTQVRRQRRRLAVAGAAAGVVAVMATVGALHLRPQPEEPHTAVGTSAVDLVSAPTCSLRPSGDTVTDVVMMVDPNATAAQRAKIKNALDHDPAVAVEHADRRKWSYTKQSTVIAPYTADGWVDSFFVRLTKPTSFEGFTMTYAKVGGIVLSQGRTCSPSAPVGGVL